MAIPLSAADGIGRTSSIYRYGRPYSFPTDGHGRPALPTLAAAEKADDPEEKLAITGQLADVIQIQTDTAIAAGSTNRLADLVFRSGQVLEALDDVVETLAGGAEPTSTSASLKQHQPTLARILTALHDTLGRIAALLPATEEETAARGAFQLHQIDIHATQLAARAGLSWRSFQTNDSGSGAGDSTTADHLDVVV